MGVTYEEYDGSPTEEETDTGWTATRTLLCAYADRKTLVDEIVGANLAYPNLTITGLTAKTASIRPHPGKQLGTGTIASYEKALVTIRYNPSDVTGTVNDESLDPTGEMMILAKDGFQWSSDSKPLVEGENPAKFIPGLDYAIVSHNWTTVPTYIIEFIGKVNNAAVSPVNSGLSALVFAAETLLFNPPSFRKIVKSDGSIVWDVSCHLTYRPNWDVNVTPAVARGWNCYWRPTGVGGGKAGIFDFITDGAGNPYRAYPLADFTKLGF